MMFYETTCLLFVIIDLTIGRYSNALPYSTIEQTSAHLSGVHVPKRALQNKLLLQNLLHQGNVHNRRSRRGIVLVDEDFDITPKPGVKLGWSDEDWNTKEADESSDLEGSASFSTIDKPSTANLTPEKLVLTSTKEAATPGVEYSDMEGSGDHTSWPTTGISTSSEGPQITRKVLIPKLCLNSTCDSNDLIISSRISRFVPEGSNLTLSCVANDTEQGVLKWYKHKYGNSSLLEESTIYQELKLDITKTELHHSGTYMCLRLTGQSCCHRRLEITIYKVPDYKNHLIIVGLVAGASLFTCILLAITRNYKAKKYEEQLELQNVEKPFLS